MTEDEAIEMLFTAFGVFDALTEHKQTDVSAHALSAIMVNEFKTERVAEFVALFDGECQCKQHGCRGQLIDAISKCMDRCEKIYEPSKVAPTSQAVH